MKHTFFCDFDGTITRGDTTDKFLERFADEGYLIPEKLWETGVIGSRECLSMQIECVKKISEKEIRDFCDEVEIDNYFITFYQLAKKSGWKIYVISDGFDVFITKILNRYNIKPDLIISNTLILSEGKLKPLFPYSNDSCESRSGTCKCQVIGMINQFKEKTVYIGDGRSDFCPALKMDNVFAKGKLYDYLTLKGKKVKRFESFKDIIDVITKEELNAKRERAFGDGKPVLLVR